MLPSHVMYGSGGRSSDNNGHHDHVPTRSAIASRQTLFSRRHAKQASPLEFVIVTPQVSSSSLLFWARTEPHPTNQTCGHRDDDDSFIRGERGPLEARRRGSSFYPSLWFDLILGSLPKSARHHLSSNSMKLESFW